MTSTDFHIYCMISAPPTFSSYVIEYIVFQPVLSHLASLKGYLVWELFSPIEASDQPFESKNFYENIMNVIIDYNGGVLTLKS